MVYFIRAFFVFNSLSLSFWVFEVKNSYICNIIKPYISASCLSIFSLKILILVLLISAITILSVVSLVLLKFKNSESTIKEKDILNIDIANDNFLPIYLGFSL